MTISSETAESILLRLRRTRATWFATLLLVFLAACGEGESEFFDPGSTRDLDALDSVDVVTLSADRTYRPRGETGARGVLMLVREGEDLGSTAYLRFGLEDLPDTASIVEGRLSFRVIGGSGDSVRVQLFEVAPEAADWREDDLPREPLPLVEPSLDTQARATLGTPGMTPTIAPALSIPASLLRRWKSDPASNRGLAVRLGTQSSGFIVVYSSEAVVTDTGTDGTIQVKTPELVIQRTDQDYTFEPDDDAYIVEDTAAPEAGDAPTLWVEQLVPHRALFLPDLSSTGLKAGDTIHKAELFLRLVPGSFSDTLDLSVGVYRNLGEWAEDAEPDTVAREPFATDVVTVTAESESLRFDFAPQVQRWIDGQDAFGLTLRVIGEGGDDGGFRVYSREGPLGSSPYVRIVSSRAPDPRWEDR